MRLSNNFKLSEFEFSNTANKFGINNSAPAIVIPRLQALVTDLLQPICDATGWRAVISSGYRCPELNRRVGGVSTSQHVKGEAADTMFYLDTASSNKLRSNADGTQTRKPEFLKPTEVADRVDALGLEYDQMIIYPNFVHLSYNKGSNRRMRLKARGV